jgi:hypothetical protein
MKRLLAVVCVAMGSVMGVQAQDAKVEPAKAMDTMIGILESEVIPAAKAMPADKYSFVPSSGAMPGAKFDGVRTFGSEVAHLASANYFFFAASSGMKPDVDVKAIGQLKTKDELVAALERSFAFAHKAAAMLTTANAFEPVEVDGHQTRITGEAFGVAHGFDHYGQMVEYLRMNGIVPPASQK